MKDSLHVFFAFYNWSTTKTVLNRPFFSELKPNRTRGFSRNRTELEKSILHIPTCDRLNWLFVSHPPTHVTFVRRSSVVTSACHSKMRGDRKIDCLTQGRRSMVIDYYWTVSNVNCKPVNKAACAPCVTSPWCVTLVFRNAAGSK